MIKLRFKGNGVLHISQHIPSDLAISRCVFYNELYQTRHEKGKDLIGVFRVDPIIHQVSDGDFIVYSLYTPGISPTPGLLSLEYDMIEDLLRDWDIIGIYDIFSGEGNENTDINYITNKEDEENVSEC